MIKFENTEVYGWEAAIRGMRNPMNSWAKSDSAYCKILDELTKENQNWRCAGCKNEFVGRPNCYIIGPNDFDLMMRLRNAGTDHRKFMRMITVYVDIIAPLYWWKEFDTYKVGTVVNSCSTMHKIADKEFTLEDFSCEDLLGKEEDMLWCAQNILDEVIMGLNHYRQKYLETKDKKYWWQMIQLLPSSYNQRRTVMLNYEVLANIYKSRKNHKLDEWSVGFVNWVKDLPYSELITGEDISKIPICHEIMNEAERRVKNEMED